jgi:hypothetical protein
MGIASIAAGFLKSGPTIEGNDERLAMIRQALETEGGRRVTAGPRLTGADNLRAGRPGSDREADPLCTRPRARQRSRSVSEDSHARAGRRRAVLRLDPTDVLPPGPNERPHAASYAPPPVGAVADPLSHA